MGAGRIHPDMLGDREYHEDKASGEIGLVGSINQAGWDFQNPKHPFDKTKSLRFKPDQDLPH